MHRYLNFKTSLIAFGIIFVATWLVSFFWPCIFGPCQVITSSTELASFGDRFGAVSAFFSGVSLLGIFWAIYQQDQQLKIARSELGHTLDMLSLAREDANKTKDILDKQIEQIRIQNEMSNRLRVDQTVDSMSKIFRNSQLSVMDTINGDSQFGDSVIRCTFGYAEEIISSVQTTSVMIDRFERHISGRFIGSHDILFKISDFVDAEDAEFGKYRAIILSTVSWQQIVCIIISAMIRDDQRGIEFCRKFNAISYTRTPEDVINLLRRKFPELDDALFA